MLAMAFYKIHSCETVKAVLEEARLEERRQLGRLCNNVDRKYIYTYACMNSFIMKGNFFCLVFCVSYFQELE